MNKITTHFYSMPPRVDLWEEVLVPIYLLHSSNKDTLLSIKTPSLFKLSVCGKPRQIKITPANKFSFLGNLSPNPFKARLLIYGDSEHHRRFARRHFGCSNLEKSEEAEVSVCYCFFDSLPPKVILPSGKVVVVGIVGLSHYLSDDFDVVNVSGHTCPSLEEAHSLNFKKFIESIK